MSIPEGLQIIFWFIVGAFVVMPINWYMSGVMWERHRARMAMDDADHNMDMVSHYGRIADRDRARYRQQRRDAEQRLKDSWRGPLSPHRHL